MSCKTASEVWGAVYLAEVVVRVLRARVEVARVDVDATLGARGEELGHVGVVHVVERHRARVLGAAQLVELFGRSRVVVETRRERTSITQFRWLKPANRLPAGNVLWRHPL